MRIGIIIFIFSFLLLSAYRKYIGTSGETIFGNRVISHITYGKYGDIDKYSFFEHPDTTEVYQKNQRTLYKINVFSESSNGEKALLHRYIFFHKNKNQCLYYDESTKEYGYQVFNKDSVLSVSYSSPVGRPTDTGVGLASLRNSVRTYNDDGVLIKELTVGPSKCDNKSDTLIYYYATDERTRVIQLAPYIDSLRNQTVIKYEAFICAPDTINNFLYHMKARGELQTLGAVKKDHYIFKVFTEMEKKFDLMVK
jgi:hypothetical protein